MKFIFQLFFALCIAVGLMTLNKYLLKSILSDFFIGWLCCMGHQLAGHIYDDYIKKIATINKLNVK